MDTLRWDLTVQNASAGDLRALLEDLEASLPVSLEKIRISIDAKDIGDVKAMQLLSVALRRHGIAWKTH